VNSFPFSLEFLVIIGFILIIELISRKYRRLKVGRLGVLGIFIALLHLGGGDITSLDFLINAVLSFVGIIFIILDKKNVERAENTD
jgi:uncharacterized membrane protein YoaK (UPF0700 family)